MSSLRTSSILLSLALTGALLTTARSWAQPAPPAETEQLERRLKELRDTLGKVKNQERPAVLDTLMCAEAVERILRHQEFFKPNYAKDSGKVLDLGFARAAAVQAGKTTWGQQPGRTVLTYRSRIDGSLQPYAVTLPLGYEKQPNKRWPLYVELHGRNGNLNEVNFFASHEGKPAVEGEHWIQVDVYGRGNNAYRWAGETDVFEAIEAVSRRYKIDDKRITLWGFSMGGAGAWHLAVHHPSRWCSAGAGAGFVDFYKYQKKTELLSQHQDRALHIYNATDYALNLGMLPMITYGGEEDPQLLASRTMETLAQEHEVPLQVLVGPKMGHKFDDESLKQFMAFHAEHSKKGRSSTTSRQGLHFETWTVKYNRCEWLTVLEQLQQYERSTVKSEVDAEGVLHITADNVAALSVDRGVADRVQVGEGEIIDLNTAADGNLPEVYFVRDENGWQVLDYDDSVAFEQNPQQHKRHNLQGPIDDAFMEPFLCVTGSGEPWSKDLQAYADWSLRRFQEEHDKFLRGQAPTKADSALTEEDIAQNNLILFGDPGSNSVLAKIVDKLPVRWTKEGCEVRGTVYKPSEHAVVFIYPNPLNPERYVVVNTGLTMHAADFNNSNAWLFPKLGDIAVLKVQPQKTGYAEETVWADLFDTQWKLSE